MPDSKTGSLLKNEKYFSTVILLTEIDSQYKDFGKMSLKYSAIIRPLFNSPVIYGKPGKKGIRAKTAGNFNW